MSSCPGSVDLERQSQKALLMEGGNKSSYTSSLDHGDLESQTQRTSNKSSSTSHKNKYWRMFRVIHLAIQFFVSLSKADKANPKASHENVGCAEDIDITGEPTEIVQVLLTSTDHSQDSIDINEIPKLQHERVAEIVKSGDLNSLQRFGGVNGIAQALRTDLHNGIPGDEKDLCSRRHIDNNHILFQGNAPAAPGFLKELLSIMMQIIGLSISILMLVVVFLRFKFGKEHDHHDYEAPEIKGKPISIQVFADFIKRISLKPSGSVNVLTTSLTLLVVGFAEGVPFIITLAIIYWNKKALCDKGYLKESLACVGMGSVTTICTGKTGGLTLSSEVVEVLLIDEQVIHEDTVIDTRVHEALCNGISALGSSIGNPFLSWATSKLGLELEILKKSCNIIDSKEIGSWKDKEGSRVLMRKNRNEESCMCLHRSGSAKTILAMSSLYYDCEGAVKILDENKRSAFHKNIQQMQSKNLKTVAFAHKMVDNYPDFEEDDVSELKDIGLEFGLLNGQERQVVGGEEFRNLCDDDRKVFNLFNTIRKPNLLEVIYRNLWFWVAVEVILLLQLAFMEIAHKLVGNAKLNGEQWGICVLIGMLSLLFDFAAKSISTLFKNGCLTVRGSHIDSAGMTHSSESTSILELPLIDLESQIPKELYTDPI
ncbi:hypothetical protein Q3G72_029039 [Acer saccharum]|nr:hypothetical protein Q3G72_029039 [Acer saccharum]